MADQSFVTNNPEPGKPAQVATRKVYRQPKLTKLGSLRDMTMTQNISGSADTMPGMLTKRGGNFEGTDRDR
jgi:hypothetical protein